MKRLLATLLLMALMTWGAAANPASFCVDYSSHPSAASLLAHDVCILDPAAQFDPAMMDRGRKMGVRYLGYLSLVEISPSSSHYPQFVKAGIRTLGSNKSWGTLLIDLTDPNYKLFFLSLAREISQKGFAGFFLDTADSVQHLAKLHPEKTAEFSDSLVSLVLDLAKTFPGSEIIVNRGFEHLDAWAKEIDGILAESVFSTFDPATGEYGDVNPSGTQWIVSRLDRAKNLGLGTYILDYVAPGNEDGMRATEKKIRDVGAAPFISTADLRSGGLEEREFKRKILVLYGHDPKLEEKPQVASPLDAAAESVTQSTLEWLGYELYYQCIVDGLPRPEEMGDYAGVIFDDSLEVPVDQELYFARFIISQARAGRKLLFLGGYPIDNTPVTEQVFQILGLKPGSRWTKPVTRTEIVTLDREMMDFEAKTTASPSDFVRMKSPDGATVHLRLRDITDKEAAAAPDGIFDAVYTCPWGGAILSPYLTFDYSEEGQLFYVNIPRFLSTIWPSAAWPVPDVTTRDGLRIFYTHIDGDGFTSASSVASENEEAICGEVIYEEILKTLPWPITVSVVEADMRAHTLSQDPKEIPRYLDVARKIFMLPHVEPASHSYSHPYIWDQGNISAQELLYDTLNMPLKLTARYPKIDLKREVQGSIDYIRENLTPADKPPAIMLWSGNCRPSPETVGLADEAGVENMNGGDTIICSRYPGLGNVSGKLIARRNRIQVLASNQNEFIYTNGWTGPFYGGFSQVVETFEKTETPVRLKPVNVYYHFYSADRPAALRALKSIYEWCARQNLHAMTAAEYARLVRDSYLTRIFRTGQNRFRLVNDGTMRTLRVANDLGYPDLEASSGVTGFHRQDRWTYVHTDGSPRTELILSSAPPSRPYLQTANFPVTARTAADKLVILAGKYATRVTVAGFEPEKAIAVGIGQDAATQKAGPDGVLTLFLSPLDEITIHY